MFSARASVAEALRAGSAAWRRDWPASPTSSAGARERRTSSRGSSGRRAPAASVTTRCWPRVTSASALPSSTWPTRPRPPQGSWVRWAFCAFVNFAGPGTYRGRAASQRNHAPHNGIAQERAGSMYHLLTFLGHDAASGDDAPLSGSPRMPNGEIVIPGTYVLLAYPRRELLRPALEV